MIREGLLIITKDYVLIMDLWFHTTTNIGCICTFHLFLHGLNKSASI
jgi:hypothetical protein